MAPRDGAAAVELRAVRFGYVPGRDVLHGVDLHIAAGSRVALVGPSGSGKSTLAALVAALLQPCAGSVYLYGEDAATLGPDRLRRTVALVSQDAHVFLGTVADNLLLVDPGAAPERLTDALRAVGALGWVEALPDGLDTAVGDGAHPLSPGQAQHLALARVVLADPPLVVLDEATAALGRGARGGVEAVLQAALAGRTVIAVAHSLADVPSADHVVHLADGRVVEAGTHAELLDRDGPYARLWRTWADAHVVEAR